MEGVMLKSVLAMLWIVMLSGCVGSSGGSSTSNSSNANLTTGPSTTSSTFSFTLYTSSQFGTRLPAFKATTNTSYIKYYQYSVGNQNSYSSLIPIGQAVAIDPTLLTEGVQTAVYLRAVHADKTTIDAPTVTTVKAELSPAVADGYYVGDRLMTYGNSNSLQEVRRLSYSGKRALNNVSDAKLNLYDADDLASLTLAANPREMILNSASPVSASLGNGKPSVVQFSFGQSSDAITAYGGYTNDSSGFGGYLDRMTLHCSGSDPVLGAVGSLSDLRLYKVKKDLNSTIGMMNLSGTLQNGLTNTPFGFYFTVQTFDNYKFVGHLRLVDLAGKRVYTYNIVGNAASNDGVNNGIIFNSKVVNSTETPRAFGFLTYDESFKITQMSIHSADIAGQPSLDSFFPTPESFSVRMLQPFNPWP
jgi:hypothetical protein